MNDDIDLTLKELSSLSQLPPLSPPDPDSYTPQSGSSQFDSSLKWYKKVNTHLGEQGHPYVCQAISVQGSKEKRARYEDIKFWPFVGPLKPWREPKDVSWNWENYEGTFAIAAEQKIIVARCTDGNPLELLWELDIDDHLYSLAWTYHPFTCHPLIAAGGAKGLIHIIDAITKKRIRVLRGHGGNVSCLSFHHLHSHILASTSYDKTTRIWNILGSDAPILPTGQKPSENYPMADADEGNCLFAVLVGEGKGGHRAYVSGAAFHLTKNTIATVGLDRQVKIWPLPQFPKPTLKPITTPLGYRAKIIHFPIFSTSRLHTSFVDNVQWLDERILVTRSRQEIVIWQWLGFARYFRPNDPLPQSLDPASCDYSDSGSFLPISRYPIGSNHWGMNISLHRQYEPTPEETENAELFRNGSLVTDPLIALVPHRQEASTPAPEILLFNPLLAQDNSPPVPPGQNRSKEKGKKTVIFETQDVVEGADDDLEEYRESDQSDESLELDLAYRSSLMAALPLKRMEGQDRHVQHHNHHCQDRYEDASQAPNHKQPRFKEQSDSSFCATSSPNANQDAPHTNNRNKSLEPWRLIASKYRPFIKTLANEESREGITRDWDALNADTATRNVAISPRGAKWIVGVGDPNTIFVWRNGDYDE